MSRELSLAIWERVCADTTDNAGRRDEEQGRLRFHAIASRIAARGGRVRAGVGRVTRVGIEINGDSFGASSIPELRPRTPGRETLVAVEARRWAHMSGEPPVVLENTEGAEGLNRADEAMTRHEIPGVSKVERGLAALQLPARPNEPIPLKASSHNRMSRMLDFVPRSDTMVPGRTTLSTALPAAVMRSAERTEIDPEAAELVARAYRRGEPLDDVLRRQLEAALATRLDSVRVHTGADANAAAHALGARAFAIGDDVFFRDGAYDPQQRDGQRLIAHEVAHTVQARGAAAPNSGATKVSQPDDTSEREADEFADEFVRSTGVRANKAGTDATTQQPAGTPFITDPSGPEERGPTSAEHRASPRVRSEPVIARQQQPGQANVPVLPPGLPAQSWARVWNDFAIERFISEAPRTQELARELVVRIGSATLQDLIAHGTDLVEWLLHNGMAAEASQILPHIHSAWMVGFVTNRGSRALPSIAIRVDTALPGLVDGMVTEGQALARAGDHARAIEVLGTAYELYQFQLMEAGPDREQQLQQGSPADAMASYTRSSLYADGQYVYDQMRRILATYSDLARDARSAGNAQLAAQLSMQSVALRTAIDTRSTWTGGEMITAEVQNVQNAQGRDALRIFGANNVNVDVTQLPGLPAPREIGGGSGQNAFTYQWSTPESVTQALVGQIDLLDELRQEVAIQTVFGTRDIDMNDTTTRLRVWSIMYRVYAQRGGGLPGLMALIGRYLHAYTVHTEYNVPDFGQSYLDNNIGTMPRDLTGRLERDCGVYALTVAYEVFRTTRAVQLPVSFRVVTMPEHVTLVIRDEQAHQFYIVNNNQVTPAHNFDPAAPNAAILGEVASAYAPVRGHPYMVSPAVEVELGSTAQSDAQFRAQAWNRYQVSAGWNLHNFAAYDDHAAGEESFYAAQRDANVLYERIDRSMTELSRVLRGGAEPAAQMATFQSGQPGPGVDEIREMMARARRSFNILGPSAPLGATTPANRRALNQAQALRFLFTSPDSHPLARIGMALLYFQAIGGQLTQADNEFISFCDQRFPSPMAAYRAAGLPPTF